MQIGRQTLYTSEPTITYSNVIDILRKVFPLHQQNVARIEFLDNYEKGEQPLIRKKTYRPDIDVQTNDNVANEVTEFKTSFHWGNPITLVQRSESEEESITKAIKTLNDCYEAENIRKKTQHLGRNVEIGGLGYTFVDINLDEQDIKNGGSYFKVESLSPSNAFVVYSNYYFDKRPMMGVVFRIDSEGQKRFTIFTKEFRFELKGYKHDVRSGELNPLGMIPVIEWIRSYDGMGCFERQIPEMDNLNLLISDFTNDVEQNTQAIWHGNDIDFPTEEIVNEDGTKTTRVRKPGTNEWVVTGTTQDGKTPFIKALAVEYDYQGMLNNIVTRRALILQKCNVPQRNDNSGGSTGIAMDSATGWSAAETQAQKQQNIMESCKMGEVRVVLSAIKNNPYVPADSPLLKLKYTDIQPSVKRSKTYELTVKTNALTTLLSHGFDLRDATQAIPMFEDNTQVVERSGEGVKKYQESQVFKADKQTEEKRPFADNSDQISNSPNIN